MSNAIWDAFLAFFCTWAFARPFWVAFGKLLGNLDGDSLEVMLVPFGAVFD
jgi:hypothetical protein